jgi:hypothetical protein
MLDEVAFTMLVQEGDRAKALVKGREIRAHAKKYSQQDQRYAEFLGNLAELTYNIDKSEESADVIQEGRRLAWYMLRNQGLKNIDQSDINGEGDVNVEATRVKIDDGATSAFASSTVPVGKDAKKAAAPPKGGKVDPKAPAAGANDGAAAQEEENKMKKLNFAVPVTYELLPADVELNSSKAPQNIYLQALPLAIRFDIRFAQICIMIKGNLEMAKNVLNGTSKLLERTLYPTAQTIFYCSHLRGLACLRIFEQKVVQFQDGFVKNRKYRQSLVDHIPHDYFALGEFMIELPNYSSALRKELKALLIDARDQYKEAIRVGRQECALYEFDFSLKDALQGLAETHFLLGEYR